MIGFEIKDTVKVLLEGLYNLLRLYFARYIFEKARGMQRLTLNNCKDVSKQVGGFMIVCPK